MQKQHLQTRSCRPGFWQEVVKKKKAGWNKRLWALCWLIFSPPYTKCFLLVAGRLLTVAGRFPRCGRRCRSHRARASVLQMASERKRCTGKVAFLLRLRWQMEAMGRAPQSPALTVPVSHALSWRCRACVRACVLQMCLRARPGDAVTAGKSYVLFTICSLSPFLKVRSDAVLDS